MKWWNKTKTFLQEVRVEIGKCYFPGRKEVLNTTVVVVITSFIFALFLFGADYLIVLARNGIFSLAS